VIYRPSILIHFCFGFEFRSFFFKLLWFFTFAARDGTISAMDGSSAHGSRGYDQKRKKGLTREILGLLVGSWEHSVPCRIPPAALVAGMARYHTLPEVMQPFSHSP
jgi:hypothetical protein